MGKQMFRERKCVHRDEGAEGDFYNGAFYVQALQRLRVDEAVQMAGKVSSFFGRMLHIFWFGFVIAAQPNFASTTHHGR